MQYLDDEPLGERIDRPRSHTWPLLPPPEIVDQTRGGKADTQEPQQSISSEISEGRKSDGTSPRKNSRKNAWGNLSYADLITQAIDSSPEKRLTLAQVYEWMVKNVHYFKDKGDSTSSAGWKNSIRHNLSLHSRFMRIQNDQNGKSSYWVINPDAKPGKATRRRSGSIEGAPKQERKRGHKNKKNNSEDGCNVSPSSAGPIRNGSKQNHSVESPGAVITMSPCSSTDSLSGLPDMEENGNYVFSSDSFTRPRSTSNVSTQSSVGGRLTPIPGDETEDDIVTSPYSNHYDGNQGEQLEISVTRPRGSSGADETAHLLESVNIRAHDTINLDDSLKYVETTVGGGGGYTATESGMHSESFSSVQSVDSGYDSSPVSTYYTSNMSPQQQPPRLNSVHNMMPLPAKPPPPPPYNSQQGVQFTPIGQPQPHIIKRQHSQQLPIHTIAEMHVHQNYYSGVPNHMVNQRGYVSTQQVPRLQHLPPQATSNVGYRKGTTSSGFRRSAMNTMSDPYLPSVTSANIKDTRNMSGMGRNSYVPSLSVLPMEQDLGSNDLFPSDLSHVPLHDFNDQFQLARDLETIIRNEMEGNMQMDFLEQQAPSSYVPSSSTVNVPGQSWVH